jgi:hypothetical protein
MKAPRFSIAGVMAVVAIVAFNVAVGRAVFAFSPEILIGTALTGLALEGAVLCLFCCRHSSRAFWVGFAALGSLAMLSFIWGRILPEDGVIVDARPGQSPRYVNVSPVSDFWLSYGSYAGNRLLPWIGHHQVFDDPNGCASVLVRAFVWSAPQLLVALLSGIACLAISRVIKKHQGRIARVNNTPSASV